MDESRQLEILQRAEALADEEKFDEAAALCDQVIDASPENAAAFNLKGFCLAASGRVPEALPCFKRARLHLPTATVIRYNLAKALEQTGDAKGAIAEYGEVLKLDGGNLEARISRIGLYDETGDQAGAGADLDELVRRAPDSAQPYLLRGAWHLTHGRPAESRPDLARALELDPAVKAKIDELVAALGGPSP